MVKCKKCILNQIKSLDFFGENASFFVSNTHNYETEDLHDVTRTFGSVSGGCLSIFILVILGYYSFDSWAYLGSDFKNNFS